jgi:hypothetical protein
VVLAGDPKQLGPVIRSPYAIKDGLGLGRSLLERVLTLPPYHRDVLNYAPYGNYNIRFITKLVNNYRSHPLILEIPNEVCTRVSQFFLLVVLLFRHLPSDLIILIGYSYSMITSWCQWRIWRFVQHFVNGMACLPEGSLWYSMA